MAKKRMGKRDARNWLYEYFATEADNIRRVTLYDFVESGDLTERERDLILAERAHVAAKIRSHIVKPRAEKHQSGQYSNSATALGHE